MGAAVSSVPASGPGSPEEPTPFVGRAAELKLLSRRLGEGRLVSVIGPSGAGKTRLAQRFASHHARGFQHAGGVWFIALRGAPDVESARLRIASVLGIAGEGRFTGEFGRAALGRALDGLGHTLLVLDNAEHLGPRFADAVIEMLDAAPRLHVLVTSRVPLDVLGEDVLDLGPMRAEAGESEAVELFVARLRSRRGGGYSASSADRAAIQRFVRRVGGFPLTLELCAATLSDRDGTEPPSDALANRAVPASLESSAAPAWAFSLLPEPLHDVLLQCSVFRGSFDLDAAAAVIDGAGTAPAILLAELAARCLVQEDVPSGRFTIAESMRCLAERELEASRGAARTRRRHAELFARMASSGGAKDGELAMARDDLEAALSYAASLERPDLVVPLAIGLDAVSAGSGLTSRQLAALDAALERSPADARLVGRALGVRSAALRGLGKMNEAAKDARVALSLARDTGDERQAVEMLLAVGTAEFQLGDLKSALRRFQTAAFEARALDFHALEGQALQQVGSVRQSMGYAEDARTYYQAVLDLATANGDELGQMRACAGLGSFHLEQGEHAPAEAHYERALLIADRLGAKRTYRIVLGYLGILYFHAGELGEAETLLERAAVACRDVGDVRVEGVFAGMHGAVLAELDRVADACRAFDLADSLLEPSPFFRQVIRIVRGHLDLAQARVARTNGLAEAEKAHLRAARYRILASRVPGRDDEPPIIARSDDARMAVAHLERAIERYA